MSVENFSDWIQRGLTADYEQMTDADLIEQMHYYNLPERDTPDGDNWTVLERIALRRWGQSWYEKVFPE